MPILSSPPGTMSDLSARASNRIRNQRPFTAFPLVPEAVPFSRKHRAAAAEGELRSNRGNSIWHEPEFVGGRDRAGRANDAKQR